MWPMLAGLGPLLGEGVCGAFHNAGGTKMSWFYRGRKAGYEGSEDWSYPKVADTPYQVQGNPRVAVLIDGETASSGEAAAIAFRGRPHTRFFGEHTLGASTNNTNFLLPDGANMILTVGVLVDRDGDEYEEGLAPDATTPSPKEIVPLDETVKTAEPWPASEAPEGGVVAVIRCLSKNSLLLNSPLICPKTTQVRHLGCTSCHRVNQLPTNRILGKVKY